MGPTEKQKKGILYVVATPIGNMEDITLRAVRVLGEVDLIAAEDTRRTAKLLAAHRINTPMTSLHDQNERQKSHTVIASLRKGLNVAYVSDAGTPGLSDPGYILINQAIAEEIRVVPIPGPAAVVAALSVSGLPMSRFLFLGFLPPKATRRRQLLSELIHEPGTLVFYESPNRLQAALADVKEVMGDRQIVVLRELTKIYEEVVRGTASEVAAAFGEKIIKGEVTLLVSGFKEDDSIITDETIIAKLETLFKARGLSRRDVVDRVAGDLDLPRQRVYRLAIKLDF
jgi:16S rRNA (cytidine1402-2'-O)-methyltransferase